MTIVHVTTYSTDKKPRFTLRFLRGCTSEKANKFSEVGKANQALYIASIIVCVHVTTNIGLQCLTRYLMYIDRGVAVAFYPMDSVPVPSQKFCQVVYFQLLPTHHLLKMQGVHNALCCHSRIRRPNYRVALTCVFRMRI